MKRSRRPQGLGKRPKSEIVEIKEIKREWIRAELINELKYRLDFIPLRGTEPVDEFVRFIKKDCGYEGDGLQDLLTVALRSSNWGNDGWVADQVRRNGGKVEKTNKW